VLIAARSDVLMQIGQGRSSEPKVIDDLSLQVLRNVKRGDGAIVEMPGR
jgi:hypothetical protein